MSMGSVEWDLVQKIILVIISVATPPLVVMAMLEIKRLLTVLQARKNWDEIEQLVRTAVRAAEQIGLAGDLARYGGVKLEAALVMAQELLNARKINLDVRVFYNAIRAIIEDEVFSINYWAADE